MRLVGARPPVIAIVIAACFGLAALSLLIPSAPTYDPWAWIVWGRELAHGALDTTGGPSWKPLPALVDAPLSVLGGAAPALWLVVARGAALVALVMAWRIAARLAGTWVAGAVAVLALALTTDWIRYAAYGTAEPVTAALVLGAVDRELAGARRAALVLGFLAALARPEIWPFFWAYAGWLAWRDPPRRLLAVALAAAVPVVWFGGDWIGSGSPLSGGDRAKKHVAESLPALVRDEFGVVAVPVLIAAAVALALGVRRRARAVLGLAAAAVAFVVLVVVMTRLGYGGNQRYVIPAAALICVVAGVGAGWVARAAGGRRAGVTAVAGLALVALVASGMTGRANDVRTQVDASIARARYERDLDRIVARVGPRRVLGCGRPDVNWLAQTELAWKLGVPLSRVQLAWNGAGPRVPFRPPAVVFVARRSRFAPGAPPPLARHQVKLRPLGRLGRWRAEVATAPVSRPTACPA